MNLGHGEGPYVLKQTQANITDVRVLSNILGWAHVHA